MPVLKLTETSDLKPVGREFYWRGKTVEAKVRCVRQLRDNVVEVVVVQVLAAGILGIAAGETQYVKVDFLHEI